MSICKWNVWCFHFSDIPNRQLPGSLIHHRRVTLLLTFAKRSESWTQDSMESKGPRFFVAHMRRYSTPRHVPSFNGSCTCCPKHTLPLSLTKQIPCSQMLSLIDPNVIQTYRGFLWLLRIPSAIYLLVTSWICCNRSVFCHFVDGTSTLPTRSLRKDVWKNVWTTFCWSTYMNGWHLW